MNVLLILLLAFHKPFGTVSQFTPDGSKHRTLADFAFPKNVYPIGRLDAESEGLLLLSDEPELNARHGKVARPPMTSPRLICWSASAVGTRSTCAQYSR